MNESVLKIRQDCGYYKTLNICKHPSNRFNVCRDHECPKRKEDTTKPPTDTHERVLHSYRRYAKGFCPVINGNCKVEECLSFRMGFYIDEKKWSLSYCANPMVSGGIDTRNC